jgi:16S rRNA (cytidine1402-2'-O)-methyltransferase
VCVPGPSAVTTAVALSGFQSGHFAFLGFLPRRGRKRREVLDRVKSSREAIVIFESAARVHGTLTELAALAPERRATLCRELTKLHEEVLRGTLAELATESEGLRGEVTLVLEPGQDLVADGLDEGELETEIERQLHSGKSVRDAVEELAGRVDLPRRELYARVQNLKERLEQR